MHPAELPLLQELPHPDLLRGARDRPEQTPEEKDPRADCLPRRPTETNPRADLRGTQKTPRIWRDTRRRLSTHDWSQNRQQSVLPPGQTERRQSRHCPVPPE